MEWQAFPCLSSFSIKRRVVKGKGRPKIVCEWKAKRKNTHFSCFFLKKNNIFLVFCVLYSLEERQRLDGKLKENMYLDCINVHLLGEVWQPQIVQAGQYRQKKRNSIRDIKRLTGIAYCQDINNCLLYWMDAFFRLAYTLKLPLTLLNNQKKMMLR